MLPRSVPQRSFTVELDKETVLFSWRFSASIFHRSRNPDHPDDPPAGVRLRYSYCGRFRYFSGYSGGMCVPDLSAEVPEVGVMKEARTVFSDQIDLEDQAEEAGG